MAQDGKVPSDLYQHVYSFLVENKFAKAAKEFIKQSKVVSAFYVFISHRARGGSSPVMCRPGRIVLHTRGTDTVSVQHVFTSRCIEYVLIHLICAGCFIICILCHYSSVLYVYICILSQN